MVPIILETFGYLCNEIGNLATLSWKNLGPEKEFYNSHSWPESFRAGCCATVRRRLLDSAKEVAEKSTGGVALIVTDNNAAAAALARFYPRLGRSHSRGSTIGSMNAYAAGKSAGHGIGLSPSRKVGAGSVRIA